MLDGRVLEASQVEYKPFGKPPLQREDKGLSVQSLCCLRLLLRQMISACSNASIPSICRLVIETPRKLNSAFFRLLHEKALASTQDVEAEEVSAGIGLHRASFLPGLPSKSAAAFSGADAATEPLVDLASGSNPLELGPYSAACGASQSWDFRWKGLLIFESKQANPFSNTPLETLSSANGLATQVWK